MADHRIPSAVLRDRVKVAVIGCGGTGSSIAGGLPRLHQSMIALGHPHGLHVTFYDGDRVTGSNTVRQAFSSGDIGTLKSEVIAHRLNLFYGLDWRAEARFVRGRQNDLADYDLVISCVDTRKARAAIYKAIGGYRIRYWLDCGNNDFDGQFVLGEPIDGWYDRPRDYVRLPTVADLFLNKEGNPEMLEPETKDPGPSCSAAESLRLQGPFVNEVIAHGALQLLARLFTKGVITYHGQFINLANGRSFPIPVPEPAPKTQSKKKPARRRSRRRQVT